MYTDKLRKSVVKKIQEDWNAEKVVLFGPTFEGVEAIENKDAFFIEIKDEIDKCLTEKYGFQSATQKSISKDSVRRFFDPNYERSFSDKIKNAFAVYLGYDDFKSFSIETHEGEAHEGLNRKTIKSSWKLKAVVLIVLLLLLSGLGYSYFITGGLTGQSLMKIKGQSTVYVNDPITVDFDLGDRKNKNAMFELMGLVEPIVDQKGELSIYALRPGMAALKLTNNGEVIDSKNVLVKTREWFPSINLTLPLEINQVIRNGIMQVRPDATLNKFGDFYTGFEFYDEFEVSADEMVFEIRAKNAKEIGGIWAYDISIDLVGKEDKVVFNILAPDAAIYSNLQIAQTSFNTPGKKRELLPFAVKMDDWRVIKLKVQDQHAQFFLDNKPIFETDYEGEMGQLLGMQLYMKGTGAIDWVKVSKPDGSVVFKDDFIR